MTANVSLDQFVYLKQPACDYLSQGYQISYHLTDKSCAHLIKYNLDK